MKFKRKKPSHDRGKPEYKEFTYSDVLADQVVGMEAWRSALELNAEALGIRIVEKDRRLYMEEDDG